MASYVLTIGFIPMDWRGNSDGSEFVLIGDTDISRTVEYNYKVGNDYFRNISTGKLINAGKCDEPFSEISKETNILSNGYDDIHYSVLNNIYEVCLEETDELDRWINLHEEGIDVFANTIKKYNGCFYCRYIVEEDGEVETEKLFVIKK